MLSQYLEKLNSSNSYDDKDFALQEFMDCINICLLAYALLGSNLFIMFTSSYSNKNNIYKNHYLINN